MDSQADSINWILAVAERIQTYFKSSDAGLIKLIESVIITHRAAFAYNSIASDGYSFMIIHPNPKQLLLDVGEAIRKMKSPVYAEALNPINVSTSLVDREYKFDANGTRFCYAIKAAVSSNYLLKNIACCVISKVSTYMQYIDGESNAMIMDKIKEIHPLYDYATQENRILGGKKKIWRPDQKRRGNARVDILSRVIEYVRSDRELANGIIFINDLHDCSATAMNIIYTSYAAKDALVDYLKKLISESFTQYSFKSFMHADFNLPHDFRLKKHSCILNDRDTQQATYLINMYNAGTYYPVPCIKLIIRDTFIHMAHPIIALRFLYIDMFMIEQRLGVANPVNHEQIYIIKMTKIFNSLQTYDSTPIWVGYYIDEMHDMIKYNARGKMTAMVETIYV
jgi:hypothetical protein